MAGTLARENAMRNPRRYVGDGFGPDDRVALVAFHHGVRVVGSLVRELLDRHGNAQRLNRRDAIRHGGMSPAVTRQIDALPETGSVTALRSSHRRSRARERRHRFDRLTSSRPSTSVRSRATFTRRCAHLAVQADEAKKAGLKIGDDVTMRFPTRCAGAARRRALRDEAALGCVRDLDGNVRRQRHASRRRRRLGDQRQRVSMAEARNAIDGVLKEFPNATLRTRDEFKGSVARQINQILGLIYVLLGMALVIALFGIANTLALSSSNAHASSIAASDRHEPSAGAGVDPMGVGVIALLGTTLGTALGRRYRQRIDPGLKGADVSQLSIRPRDADHRGARRHRCSVAAAVPAVVPHASSTQGDQQRVTEAGFIRTAGTGSAVPAVCSRGRSLGGSGLTRPGGGMVRAV